MLGQTIWAARSRRVIVARTESAQWMASGCSEETDTVCAPSIAGDTPLRLAMPTSAAKATEKELMPRKRGRLSTMVLKRPRFRGISSFSVAFAALVGIASLSGVSPAMLGAQTVSVSSEQPDAIHWADSVLATMTLRDRAAQMVWPNIYADYVPADAASWRRITSYVRDQKVGGILMSIGSPIEMAVKLNALQRLSYLPLIVGADLETGAG